MANHVSRYDRGERILPNVFGYKNPSRSSTSIKAIIKDDEKKVIEEIFDLYVNEKMPAHQIASQLNKNEKKKRRGEKKRSFTPRFILHVLNRLEYVGQTKNSHKTVIPSKIYPQLIPSIMFIKAKRLQELKRHLKLRGSVYQKKYPLSGLITCSACEESFYIKNGKEKNGNLYYSHSSKKNGINHKNIICTYREENISNIVYSVYFTLITHKKNIEKLFTLYFFRFHFFDDINRLAYARFAKNWYEIHLNHDVIHKKLSTPINANPIDYANTIRKINEYIISNWKKNTDAFSKYMKKIIKKWFNSDYSKTDILLEFYDTIKIDNNSLILHIFDEFRYRIRIKPLNAVWKKHILMYQHSNATDSDNNNSKIQDLFRNMNSILTSIKNKQLTIILKDVDIQTHELIAGQPSADRVHLDNFISFATYMNINNRQLINDASIYKNPRSNTYYLTAKDANKVIKPNFFDQSAISFRSGNNSYINTDFLHQLPEWLYGYNYQYFIVGKKKVCFIEEDNEIKAFMLSYKGKRTEIPFDDAIKMIQECKDAKYVDLD